MGRPPPLYAICDTDVCRRAGWRVVDLASACLEGGARFLQIRAKDLAGGAFLETAAAVVERARAVGALVVVNDRADVARLARAGGVHVGQDDVSPEAARKIAGDAACVGLSTHTPAQLNEALASPLDYVAVGPVFATSTKTTGFDPVGLAGVKAAAARTSPRRLPLIAIGGITLDRAGAVIAAGADSVAVISDLLTGGDPTARVRAWLDALS